MGMSSKRMLRCVPLVVLSLMISHVQMCKGAAEETFFCSICADRALSPEEAEKGICKKCETIEEMQFIVDGHSITVKAVWKHFPASEGINVECRTSTKGDAKRLCGRTVDRSQATFKQCRYEKCEDCFVCKCCSEAARAYSEFNRTHGKKLKLGIRGNRALAKKIQGMVIL